MIQKPPDQKKRSEVSKKLWDIAREFITAEWICCDPIDEHHSLCQQGRAALIMAETLLVDVDPQLARHPAAPVLDAVMGLLGADERVTDDLNKANVTLARALDVREEQLGKYLTLLHLEQQRTNAVREALGVAKENHHLFDNTAQDAIDRIELALGEDTDACAEGHIYLSTGCLHGREGHTYCQSMTGLQGAKRGGRCKWCDAPCICACHAGEKAPEKPLLKQARCNHAQTHWPQVPHNWEPQPGMDKLHCTGHPDGPCNDTGPIDPEVDGEA